MSETDVTTEYSNGVEELLEHSIATHRDTNISIRATEIVATYETYSIDEGEYGKPTNEIGIFNGIPPTIPFWDSYIRLADDPDTVVGMDTTHYIKFESPDLVVPLYVTVQMPNITFENNTPTPNEKFIPFIGVQDPDVCHHLNPTGDVFGELVGNVMISEDAIRIPDEPPEFITTADSDDEFVVGTNDHGILSKLFGGGTKRHVKTGRRRFSYCVGRPDGAQTVFTLDGGKHEFDEIMTVTVSVNSSENTCEFEAVDSDDVYHVDLINGQMGENLIQFFDQVGTENINGEFSIRKTYFPNTNTVETNTYGVYLCPGV